MRKIGAYLPAWKGLDAEERLRQYKNAGFEVLCITIGGILSDNPNCVSPRLAEKYGFEIENVHLTGGGTNKIWLPGEPGEEIVRRYCDEIKLCASLGIKIGITHVTWGSHEITPDISPLGLERFRRIAECAARNNFMLALENSVSAKHLYYALDDLTCDCIGFCYDSGHRYCYTPDDDFISKYGNRMVAMHLDDNDGVDDIHLLPFDGIAPWDRVISDLAKTPLYERNIVFEPSNNGRIHRELPGLDAAQIKERLSRIAIASDEELVQIQDGSFDIYPRLSYEEYLDRMWRAGLRIAGR